MYAVASRSFFERYGFVLNLLSTLLCSVVVSIAAFTWLRGQLPQEFEVGIELIASAVFLSDMYLNRRSNAAFFRTIPGVLACMLGSVPWYTLSFFVASVNHHPLYLMLAHASFAPYLLMRFKWLAREHIVPKAVKVSFGINLFFFAMHWLATIWMLLKPDSSVDFLTEYNLAMYFLMSTLATVGYGDIAPVDNLSRIFTMFLELMGVCVFGLVIGQLSRMIMSADRRKEHIQNELEALTALVHHYKIPDDLQKKTYKFFRHVLNRSTNEEEMRVLSRLPATLQAEIRVYMNAKPLARVSLFKNCSQTCLVDAAHELKQEFFNPGQHIIKKGDFGDVMYLIGHGNVKIHDGEHFIASLEDGHCFGEMALLNGETRKADATALTHCDVFVLTRERFQHLLNTHPDLKRQVDSVINLRKAQ